MPLLPGVLPSQSIVTGPIVSYPINARRYALIPVKPNPLSTRNPNPTENPTTWTKIAEVLTPNPWERDPLAVGFDDYYQVPPPNSRSSDSSVGAVPDDTSDPGFYDFQGTVQVYSGIGFQSSGVPPQLPPVDIEVPHVSEADFLGDYAYFQNVLDGNVSPSGAEVTHLYNGFSFVAGQRVVLPSQSNPPDIYFEAPFGNITQQSRDVGTLALTAPDQPDAFMAGTTKIVSVLDSDIPANLGLRQSWLTNAYFNMPAKILVKVNVSAFVDYTYVFTLRDFVPGRVIVDRGLGTDNNSDFSAWGYSASGMSHAVFDYARYEAFEKVIEPINLNPIAGSANISIGNAITNPGGTGTGTDTGPTIIIP